MNERLVIALRALSAITNYEAPDPEDIEQLRSWVSPKSRNAELDELACAVIRAELRRKQNTKKE